MRAVSLTSELCMAASEPCQAPERGDARRTLRTRLSSHGPYPAQPQPVQYTVTLALSVISTHSSPAYCVKCSAPLTVLELCTAETKTQELKQHLDNFIESAAGVFLPHLLLHLLHESRCYLSLLHLGHVIMTLSAVFALASGTVLWYHARDKYFHRFAEINIHQ